MTIEILEPKLSRTERDDLERALALIERDTLATKLTRALGGNFDWIGRRLPAGAKRMVAIATEHALKRALKVAVSTAGCLTVHHRRGIPVSFCSGTGGERPYAGRNP